MQTHIPDCIHWIHTNILLCCCSLSLYEHYVSRYASDYHSRWNLDLSVNIRWMSWLADEGRRGLFWYHCRSFNRRQHNHFVLQDYFNTHTLLPSCLHRHDRLSSANKLFCNGAIWVSADEVFSVRPQEPAHTCTTEVLIQCRQKQRWTWTATWSGSRLACAVRSMAAIHAHHASHTSFTRLCL